MADNITRADGKTVATDEIGGVHFQRAKLAFGVDGTSTDVSAANPVPINDRTPTFSAPLNQTAVSVTLVSTFLMGANANRRLFELVNTSSTSSVWVAFGATAVANTGIFLLPGATYYQAYSGAANAIAVGGTVVLALVEW